MLPVNLSAFPDRQPDSVSRSGSASIVFIYSPRGPRDPGAAIKVLLPHIALRHGRVKTTLPATELELRAHLAARRALGPLYPQLIAALKAPGAVYKVDGCLHPKDLVSLKFRSAESDSSLMPAYALIFDYGGERLAAAACQAARLGFFQGLASVGAALELFRRRGFAHLDIKADNVLVHRGRFRLADLGLFSRAAASGGSLLETFLEDGRCYGLWPLDFYLASPRWRAAQAILGLEAEAYALEAAALAREPAGALADLAGRVLAAAEALDGAAGSLLPAELYPDGVVRLTAPPLRRLRAAGGRRADGCPAIAPLEICSLAIEFCVYVRRKAHSAPDLTSTNLASFQPYHAQLERYREAAASLGVEPIWDGRQDTLRRFEAGLRAACAAPGPRGALARFGSGVDVYMLGRLLLDLDTKGARLPRGGVELACRMVSLDPSRRPSAGEAARALAELAREAGP